MRSQAHKTITAFIEINAGIQAVWDAWTTEEGVRGFFAPECLLNPRPGGAYEMYFDPTASAGSRGGEGCRILAMQEPNLLSFTWNQPPSIPTLRSANQETHVIVWLEKIGAEVTRVYLQQDGWGTGEDWEEAYHYFDRVWQGVVLPRLKQYLENGYVD
jgi:uncharacterized protein YndB with AHSA1/START domain